MLPSWQHLRTVNFALQAGWLDWYLYDLFDYPDKFAVSPDQINEYGKGR